ncbi:metal ABC transporter ATP-binding protein [Pyrofollis japonicus]|uniref:metal ABC transporter ATP-binding protein n=1 Tax=Pyrofollis japonicus TaxID=3060460 RepID=UPI00295BED44|nr:metal ABC transporter ATP-binding protein [Pyrofollis japonicus]BEP18534.1 metal ABC transporter ATP-binding protein [Pyrofollis japonicus]
MLSTKLSTRPETEHFKQNIRVENVVVKYGDFIALEVERLDLRGPGLIQILGPNGAGKTTLLRTILGLIKPYRGRVEICGIDVTGNPRQAGTCTGYVPQILSTVLHYPLTPWELVFYELKLRKLLSDKAQIIEALRRVGLPESVWHKPLRNLSGGQRQRAFIARAIAYDPPILLMDEPFSAVDPAGRAELAKLVGELSESRLVIVTSHDPMLLLRYTKEIVLVNKRIVAAGLPSSVLRRDILGKVYGESIMWVERHIHISDSHISS